MLITSTATKAMIAATGASLLALGATPTSAAPIPSDGWTESCADYMVVGCIDSDGTALGRIRASGSLSVRSGPGTKYPRRKTLRTGKQVWISCWATGQRVTARGVTSNAWDYIIYPTRGWVADIYVDTGGIAPNDLVPSC